MPFLLCACRELLSTLQVLPISWPLLQGSSLLQAAVRCMRSRDDATAVVAQRLLRHWSQRFDELAVASVVQKTVVGKGTMFLQVRGGR